jgi:hypothetical protein
MGMMRRGMGMTCRGMDMMGCEPHARGQRLGRDRVSRFAGCALVQFCCRSIHDASTRDLSAGYLAADPFGFRPTNRFVITEHPWELSWLFGRIAEAYGPALGFRSRYVFFGSLADSANRYLHNNPGYQEDARGLLLAVLDEADGLASETRE